MASFVGHFAAGYTCYRLFNRKNLAKLIILSLVSSWLPDIDVITFKMGIPYGDMFGHRGFTHSIFFAVAWAMLVAATFQKGRWIVWLTIFTSTLSHGLLDALTTGGKGVAFFAPFSDERYFLPWRMIKVSPVTISEFFGPWGKAVVLSEIRWILLPCAVILLALNLRRMKRKEAQDLG